MSMCHKSCWHFYITCPIMFTAHVSDDFHSRSWRGLWRCDSWLLFECFQLHNSHVTTQSNTSAQNNFGGGGTGLGHWTCGGVHHFITGLMYSDKQPFTVTFTAKSNLESQVDLTYVTTLPVLSPSSDISRVVSSIGTTWAVRVWVLVTLSWSSVAGWLSSQRHLVQCTPSYNIFSNHLTPYLPTYTQLTSVTP